MSNQNNIRHHDLSKLSEKQLMDELNYLEFWSNEIYAGIKRCLDLIGRAQRLQIPISKLQYDLQCAIDRQAAILEELNYRDIP